MIASLDCLPHQVPSFKSKLLSISGIELPSSLRAQVWQTTLLLPTELEHCEHRLRGSTLAALAAGHTSSGHSRALSTAEMAVNTAEMAVKLEASTDLPMRMLARGLAMFDEPTRAVVGTGAVVGAASPALLSGSSGTLASLSSRSSSDALREETEGRACALLLQAHECSAAVPISLGSLAIAIALGVPAPEHPYKGQPLADRTRPLPKLAPVQRPLEPASVAMLLRAHSFGVAESRRAAQHPEKGVQALLEQRWPRLLKHLHAICAREDLADVHRRARALEFGVQAPRTELQKVIDEEWLVHGFVGALPVNAMLWAWDQFSLQGWSFAAELAACCFWLVRLEVRRLDHAGAGATELRGVMRTQLRQEEHTLHQLQTLLARSSEQTRSSTPGQAVGASPQVMIRVPYCFQ